MQDLIDNYYSYYDEKETDYPDLGLIFYDSKPPFDSEVAWFTGLYRDTLNGNAVAVVAEEQGRVVGMCDVHRVRPGSEVSHTGVLGIAITKGYRDMGLGAQLMKTALEKCRGKFEIITLAAFTTNKRAISLYNKLGFVEHGMVPMGVKRKDRYYDEIHMHLKL